MSEHAWVQENLDAYVTNGLSAQERSRVDRHLGSCNECAHAQAEIQEMEQLMEGLCARVRPDAGLEDRAIQRLRQARKPRPSWLRFVTAAAAVIVLGVIGGGVQVLISNGVLPLPGMEHKVAERENRTLLSKAVFDAFKFDLKMENDGPPLWVPEDLLDPHVNYGTTRIDEISVPGVVNGKDVVGITDGDKGKSSVTLSAPSQQGQGGSVALHVRVQNGDAEDKRRELGRSFFGDESSQEKEKVKDRKEDKEGTYYARDLRTELDKNKPGDKREESLLKLHMKVTDELAKDEKKDSLDKAMKDLQQSPKTAPAFGPYNGKHYSRGPGAATTSGPGYYNMAGGGTLPGSTTPTTTSSVNGRTFQPTTPPPVQVVNQGPGAKEILPNGEARDKKPAADPAKTEPTVEQKPEPKQAPPTGRMIIRTGEMEFETDSFDNTVDAITKLITNVKGGFIATINSDKLANGKTKGSVIVRMPPTLLDKFIYDLRRELAKTSELKNQRLGSLDVTKQYTDIESRLRAARAIEERLIAIIKTGKGEIKDLVAAERELGIWRTKIEEMEGEIRYYTNQVSLSTLTISLYEKEIQAPTAIVVTETVMVRIEVDEVAKAHQSAMKAVEELKGRITHSELKQHTAGQFLSIVHAEIPPGQKEAFIERLETLGIVSDFQENQRQHTEGGTGKAPSLKPKQSDVRFEVTMHNTANIRPRLSADLKVATTDVPGSYNKLLAAIAKAKGQVRDGKLNEQDKLNIHAFLDFTVPTTEKPAIDKLIDEIGPILERINAQCPVSELSTDRKFGYTLLLRDFASIPPSKALIQIVATLDVPASYAKLQDAIAKAKGQIADARLNEQDKFNVSAQLEFTVPSEEKAAMEKLLADLGTVLSRNNIQTPVNVLATPKTFGFSIALRDFASILPSHAADIKLATSDVQGNYAKLVDAVVKAKGQISEAKLNEQDKLNITALLNFTVPIGEKPALDKLLSEIGPLLSRNNVQAPQSTLTTDRKFGYAVVLRDFNAIAPRETFHLTIAATDVPASFRELQDAVAAAKGLVTVGKLVEDSKTRIEATFEFDIPASERQAIEKLFSKVGAVLGRASSQAPVNDLATDQKVGYRLILRSTAAIPPRDTTVVKLEVKDVDAKASELKELVVAGKGRIIDSNIDRHENGQVLGVLKFEVPFASEDTILRQIKGVGTVVSQQAKRNPQVAENELTTAHIIVTLAGVSPIVPSDEGLGSYVRASLSMSFKVFSVCLMLIILGVSAVLPWALVIWVVYKVYCKLTAGNVQLAPAGGPTPPSGGATPS